MVAYTYRMPSGIPGTISRESQSTVESTYLDPTTPFPAYGRFAKNVAGKSQPIGAADVATSIYGLLIRPFPTTGLNPSDPLSASVPPTSGVGNLVRRGYVTVQNNFGTAALGGIVYIRIAVPSGPKVIGGIEAASDGANTIIVPNCNFMSAADASGNVEIAYNI